MVVEFEGIRFDTVDELVEYKQHVGALLLSKRISFEAEIKPVTPEPKPEKVFIKVKSKKGKKWSRKDIKLLKETYAEKGGKRYVEGLSVLMGRSQRAVYAQACTLGISSRPGLRPGRPKPVVDSFIKRKPKEILTFDATRIGLANQGVVEGVDDLPGLYPLSDEALHILEQMIVQEVVGAKGKINYFRVKDHLTLVDNIEWSPAVWYSFIDHFAMNLGKIRTALNCEHIGIVMVNGHATIGYKNQRSK